MLLSLSTFLENSYLVLQVCATAFLLYKIGLHMQCTCARDNYFEF